MFDDNEKYKFELWWKFFEFHADQRLRAFYYFLIIIGALSIAYYTCYTSESFSFFRFMTPYICVFSMIISLAFFFIEIRNVQLVNTGRETLKILIVNIEGSDEALDKSWGILHNLRKIIPGWLQYLLSPIIKHQFWLRLIYLLVFFTAFLLLLTPPFYIYNDLFKLFLIISAFISYFSTLKSPGEKV